MERMTLDKSWSGDVLTIKFQNHDAEGKVVGEAASPVVFDQSKASVECRAQAERHGWEQRLGDRAAMSRDSKSGKSATPEEKRTAVAALADYYAGGATDWNLRGGPRALTPEQELALFEALAKKLGKKVVE